MRVLVVEDERALADVVRRGLTREGFVVDVVHDGQDGLWAASETVYDVIVLDIMLPRLDGYQVIARLRQAGVWTPVMMLTAVDGEHDQAEAFNLGADDYLTKPFSFVVLVARLRALIRRGAPERPVVMTNGSLSLDPVRRRVTRSGTEIALTPKEFALLTFLMRHPGEVVTKTAILEAVWDPAYDGDMNIVEVYVGYLRRKIDVPFGVATIETVRGAGYRLLEPDRD
ncbi:response regulator transcription factor [Terrabacter aerolatus]|uniref:DNA-binding response regulator n=1 Tax=Terrabacter aerolatus TaxID=422442 RepID=A0A512D017_9MICO|nr:response regulator transcription factor [Terrabacter aerolatus]GEO29600.1 DNA-binding response regulator [Terrabacter aerolatus]